MDRFGWRGRRQRVRRLGLGTLIGTRTWGGGVWLRGVNGLVDRGIASAAEFGTYAPEGKWVVEGPGIDPDIVVDNLPHATFNGNDAQLDAAIKFLKEKIAADIPLTVNPQTLPRRSSLSRLANRWSAGAPTRGSSERAVSGHRASR